MPFKDNNTSQKFTKKQYQFEQSSKERRPNKVQVKTSPAVYTDTGTNNKFVDSKENTFIRKADSKSEIHMLLPIEAAVKESLVPDEKSVTKDLERDGKLFPQYKEAFENNRVNESFANIGAETIFADHNFEVYAEENVEIDIRREKAQENEEKKVLQSARTHLAIKRKEGEKENTTANLESNNFTEGVHDSFQAENVVSQFVTKEHTEFVEEKNIFQHTSGKLLDEEALRGKKEVVPLLKAETNVLDKTQLLEKPTEKYFKEEKEISAEESLFVKPFASKEMNQFIKKTNVFLDTQHERQDSELPGELPGESLELKHFQQKKTTLEQNDLEKLSYVGYQNELDLNADNYYVENGESQIDAQVDDKKHPIDNARYGFIESARPEFIDDISTNADFVGESAISLNIKGTNTVNKEKQVELKQRTLRKSESEGSRHEKQREDIEVTSSGGGAEFVFWHTEEQGSIKSKITLFKGEEKNRDKNFISKYDRFIDKVQKAFEKSKEDEEDETHVSRMDLFAEGVLEYRLNKVMEQHERYQNIWVEVRREERRLKKEKKVGTGIFAKKSFVDKGEQFEKLKAKKKAIKKADNKEIRKAARLAAATKVINAKRNMQGQLGNMKGEASGDLMKDGSRGLLKTFSSIVKDIGATIGRKLKRKILLYLTGILGPVVTFMLMIMISSIVLLNTVSAVVTGLAVDSDSGEDYSLDINGDGRVYTSLTDEQISDILHAVNEIYGGISWHQETALRYALSKVGCEYNQLFHYSLSVDKFDCSSLVYRAYRAAYMDVSYAGVYTAADECYKMVMTNRLSNGDLRPGDLIFYGGADNGRYLGVYHVAMYVGNINGVDKMVEARGASWGVVYCDVRGNNVVKIGRPYI